MRKPSVGLALIAIVCAFPVAAQARAHSDSGARRERTIAGQVLDETARALSGVEVRVLGSGSTLTDSTGRFSLGGLPVGPLQLLARKVGFDSASTIVPESVTEVSLVLTRSYRLTEIVVEGKVYNRVLWDRGFYHRQKIASGTFFDSDVIDHFGGDGLGSLIRQVPRVDVRYIGNSDYAFSSIAGRTCRMNIYIDGMFQRVAMPGPLRGMGGTAPEGVGLKDLIGFREIAAIEVYPRANSVPTQFQRMGPPAGPQGISSSQIPSPVGTQYGSSQRENQDAACGAIVIWTKSVVNSVPIPASAP